MFHFQLSYVTSGPVVMTITLFCHALFAVLQAHLTSRLDVRLNRLPNLSEAASVMLTMSPAMTPSDWVLAEASCTEHLFSCAGPGCTNAVCTSGSMTSLM